MSNAAYDVQTFGEACRRYRTTKSSFNQFRVFLHSLKQIGICRETISFDTLFHRYNQHDVTVDLKTSDNRGQNNAARGAVEIVITVVTLSESSKYTTDEKRERLSRPGQ